MAQLSCPPACVYTLAHIISTIYTTIRNCTQSYTCMINDHALWPVSHWTLSHMISTIIHNYTFHRHLYTIIMPCVCTLAPWCALCSHNQHAHIFNTLCVTQSKLHSVSHNQQFSVFNWLVFKDTLAVIRPQTTRGEITVTKFWVKIWWSSNT